MPSMHRPALQLAQDRTGGRLADLLAEWRERGDSWEAISRQLWAEHGVSVTRQTLVVWWHWLQAERAQREAEQVAS